MSVVMLLSLEDGFLGWMRGRTTGSGRAQDFPVRYFLKYTDPDCIGLKSFVLRNCGIRKQFA